jgi:hypothetical protein
MNRTFLSRAVLLLVLILLLGVSSAQAAEPRPSTSPAHGVSSGLAAWGFVAQAWDFLTGIWANNGCGLEPDGRCLPDQGTAAEADNGCGLEPSGRCGS